MSHPKSRDHISRAHTTGRRRSSRSLRFEALQSRRVLAAVAPLADPLAVEVPAAEAVAIVTSDSSPSRDNREVKQRDSVADDQQDPLSPWEKFCVLTAEPSELGGCLDGVPAAHPARGEEGLAALDPLGRGPSLPGGPNGPDDIETGFPPRGFDGPGGYTSGDEEPDYPAPTISLRNGVLRIQGSQEGDNIWVNDQDAGIVEVLLNGDRHEFDRDDVHFVLIFGLAGDDVIGNTTSIDDAIFGGLGDDNIEAGNGVSVVHGQGGNDTIIGNDGDDFLFGGEGNDRVEGLEGSDVVDGGAGDDYVGGGISYDPNDGSADTLIGGAGADDFCGGYETLDVFADFDATEGDQEDCSP